MRKLWSENEWLFLKACSHLQKKEILARKLANSEYENEVFYAPIDNTEILQSYECVPFFYENWFVQLTFPCYYKTPQSLLCFFNVQQINCKQNYVRDSFPCYGSTTTNINFGRLILN